MNLRRNWMIYQDLGKYCIALFQMRDLQRYNFRMENNDTLMKIHKEILEQKSKMERAQRELKLGRKSAKQKVLDREYFIAFEVNRLLTKKVFQLNSHVLL